MKTTSIIYPHSTSHALYNKENHTNYAKSRPQGIPSSTNPFFTNAYFPPTTKSRSPFTTKANYYDNGASIILQKLKPETEVSQKDIKSSNEYNSVDRRNNKKPIDFIDEALNRIKISRKLPEEVYRELVEENVKLKGVLLEKAAESEDLKRKLCDERVERKISTKKLEAYECKIKELLNENEKLNHSLNSRLEHALDNNNNNNNKPSKSPKEPFIPDLRETMTSKDLENRVKALSTENKRLFMENEELINELKENRTKTQREIEGVEEEVKERLIREKELAVKEYKAIENQLEQYKIKAKDLECELVQSHVCISDLEKKLKSLLNQQQENINNNSILNMSRTTNSNNNMNKEDEIRSLRQVTNRYKQEISKLQEILENRRKEMDLVKRELEKSRKDNRKLIKTRLEFEENLDKERKEKDEYKELIENQSVILREKELELDEKMIEIDEIRKGFLDLSQQQDSVKY